MTTSPQRECPPKPDRKGRMAHYVPATIGGKRRCLKAGGDTAKRVLRDQGCPPGKVYAFLDGKHRCIRAGGATAKAALGAKGCRPGQVLAEGPASGRTPDGQRWSKTIRLCLTEETARRKGFRIVGR